MKKILLLFVVFLFSAVSGYAQSEVTRFLGIPIDGTKSEMIKQLKKKGYIYKPEYDRLEGEFNGTDVYISVVTNNNKVYRICVCDRNTVDETNIKIRFNRLCYQFGDTKRYIGNPEDYIIPEDEDISYEMTVHNKRYQAVFYQNLNNLDEYKNVGQVDSTRMNGLMETLEKWKESPDQIDLSSFSEEDLNLLMLLYEFAASENRHVWFKIEGKYGKYRILMYYDNLENQANGEDL